MEQAAGFQYEHAHNARAGFAVIDDCRRLLQFCLETVNDSVSDFVWPLCFGWRFCYILLIQRFFVCWLLILKKVT
jgi:hypothetical protein